MYFSWAHTHAVKLREMNSSLEFKLHRLKFINLIKEGPSAQLAALYYSKNFEKFADQHARGIHMYFIVINRYILKRTENYLHKPAFY